MSDPMQPRNSLSWRVERLEKEMETLQRGQPAVIAERVANLSKDVHDLGEEVKSMRRAFLGLLTTLALVGIGIAVSLFTTIGAG